MAATWRQAAAAIASCVRAASVSVEAFTPDRVAAVGICGHSDGVYPIDAAGAPLRPAILATDSRARSYVERYLADGTADKALPLTGQSPFAGSPASLYAWLRDEEPRTLDAARWLLCCKDWLRLGLTGEVATDLTDGSASFTDVTTHEYAAEALALYGLAGIADRLPAMLRPTDVAGHVTAEAAAETGLAAGTPVVAGAHDVHASALGVGAIRPGDASIVMGTFSINQIVAADVRLDHRWQARSFLERGAWLHMSTSPSSASNLDWAVRLLGPSRPDGQPDFPAAVREGFAAPPGPLFLPFLHTVGATLSGVFAGHGRADLLRAVLDGVVFGHRTHLDALRTQFTLRRARLCGGGARSPQWSQHLADVAHLDLEVADTEEAGARGAALLAGIGVGRWATLDEAVAATVRVSRRHQSTPRDELDERYARYVALAAAQV
jgi:L-xylulokinase